MNTNRAMDSEGSSLGKTHPTSPGGTSHDVRDPDRLPAQHPVP